LAWPALGHGAGKNLLRNPGFERVQDGGPVDWRCEKGNWDDRDGADQTISRSGEGTVRVVCPVGGHHQTAVSDHRISVEPGTRYRLTSWSKSTGGEYTYMLAWFHGKALPKESYQAGGMIRGEHDWALASFVFTAPADAGWVDVRLGIKYAATAWFDDVSLVQVSDDEVDNVLVNSSFEIAATPGYPDAWRRISYKHERRFFEPGYWGLDDTTAYHGRYSLKIAAPLRTYSVWNEAVRAPYTFSIYLRSNRKALKARIWAGDGSKVVSVGQDWQRYSVTASKVRRFNTVYLQPMPSDDLKNRGCTWADTGKFGKALVFDGHESVLDLGEMGVGDALAQGTIEFWMRPAITYDSSLGKIVPVLSRDNARPALLFSPSGTLYLSMYDGKTHHTVYTRQTRWEAGRWYQIAISWGAQGLRIYVDGEPSGQTAFAGTYEYRGASRWLVGRRGDMNARFNGAIDELRVSGRPRPLAELTGGPYAPSPGTLLLLHFDKPGTLTDSSKPPLAPAVLWGDAAQLEEGTTARPYTPSWRDMLVNSRPEGEPRQVSIRLERGPLNMFPASTVIAGGKPFLPVWIWGLTIEDAAKLKKHGLNCVLCGSTNLAAAQDAGLKVLYTVPSAWRIRERDLTQQKLLGLVREDVAKHRRHPAIIGWFTCDEPRPEKGLTHELLLAMYNAVHVEDPDRPVYINCAIGNAAGAKSAEYLHTKLGGYVPAADLIGTDPYPVPTARLDAVARQVDIVRAQAPGKPISMVLQFFSGGRFLREPTPRELTCMWYLCLVHGARSIGLYSRRPTSAPLWEQMKVLASETRRLAPDLTNVEDSGFARQIPDGYASGIHCLARRCRDQLYLIAVNAEHTEISARFTIPNLPPNAEVSVEFEGRALTTTGDTLRDVFKPYERHVYVMPLAGR